MIHDRFFKRSGLRAFSWVLILSLAAVARQSAPQKTPLLSDAELKALSREISGIVARDHVSELCRYHRVQASSGFSHAAEYVARKAKEYGLEQVQIERLPADGRKSYHTLKSTPGWEAESGELWEVTPNKVKIADFAEMNVALADYSQSADLTASLIDVGAGASPSDYDGKDVKGKIVLAGGNVATVHRFACDERGATGILSYQQNQVTAWSGDYVDNVRWGHLSPYNPDNKFAFMISLRRARALTDRLARGENITLRAVVNAEMRASSYDLVTAIIPGEGLPDEEIVYSCHLCHQKPGANDNASGAAAILEVARALTTLIRRGDIERPRRTIRFIWPPEIAGTLAYFAEHPEVVRRMKAAVHCDMVGGNYAITKSVLHLTHTPASLPSCVNTVGDIFMEYVMAGSVKAAMGEGDEDALISTGGSKESLVGDITPYDMGSDHDVYQEGSFRIPTIYLRDWPDVFIHTNNDVPANIDPTKIKRSTFIAAASGYFLSRAGSREAVRLADEVFARELARVPHQREAARRLEADGGESEEEARNKIARSLEVAAAAIASAQMFSPEDRSLEARVESLIDQLSGAWLLLTGQLRQEQKGRRISFIIEPKEQPRSREQRPRNPKEATRGQSAPEYAAVPVRRVIGPMSVYYYNYLEDHAASEDLRVVARLSSAAGRVIPYEILNLVDGRRTVRDIRDYIAAAYQPIPIADVLEYLRLLEKAGVVGFE